MCHFAFYGISIRRFIFLMCSFSSFSFCFVQIVSDRQIIIMRPVLVTYLKWIASHWLQHHHSNKTMVSNRTEKREIKLEEKENKCLECEWSVNAHIHLEKKNERQQQRKYKKKTDPNPHRC